MLLEKNATDKATDIYLVEPDSIEEFLASRPQAQRQWVNTVGFKAKSGTHCVLPDAEGNVSAVLFGMDNAKPLGLGILARDLPVATYRLANPPEEPALAELMCLGWCMGGYHFERYLSRERERSALVCPDHVNFERVGRASAATALARDLINTPANDLGPSVLEATIRDLGARFGATVNAIVGEELLEKDFPMIHAVGRAAADAPRLVELNWTKVGSSKNALKVTLVGKGVCFDTGGLNLKPGNSMALMKKDMGGAANVLGLAMMIMDAELDVNLRVLIPAVENNISGDAFRPGDILPSRDGMSVEIGNTDAEGRLILADALTLADADKPDLLIDMATLTGAARVALGPDLPPFFTRDEALAEEISLAADDMHDPLWRLPLYGPYDAMLSSSVADVSHISSGGFAGSITAALFLARFVKNTSAYVHFDIFGWNPADKPQSRKGGEAQAIRALYSIIEKRSAG